MQIFEYPYIIITILVMIFILLGLIGLYFTIKSVRTARSVVAKSFCGLGKMENDFNKDAEERKNRCLVYVAISLEEVKRLYSDSKAGRLYEQIKRILLRHLCLEAEGVIAHYGKENFVALSGLRPKEIEAQMDQCIQEIHDVLQKFGAVNLVPVHFGYHTTESNEVSFKSVLARAKQACSMAEDESEPYCRWETGLGRKFERKLKIENNIQSEIENNRFFLEYQPILDAKTEKIMGAEVLARLNSPTEGILSPKDFLSAVNNVGLNREFDYYIFEKNCKWIASDMESRSKYVYTINFSRHTLCDPELAKKLIGIMENYAINCSCIAVEVLEDQELLGDDKAVMIQNLATLKGKGVLILLDDFGKGYAGFDDLMELDISIVKIDRAIIRNAANPNGFTLLENMIRTAHELGYRTICEGIETEEHKKLAVQAGGDILQGYYFYRPMPVTKLEALFKGEA